MERMKNIILDKIQIGQGYVPLVIPEIGINHNGSLAVAKKMVDAAFKAGARIIKHQTHIVEDEMCEAAKHVIPGNADISIFDIMAQAALNEEEELELKKYTEAHGMVYMSTPFSRAAADRLERFGVEIYKIGSGELNNYPLLEHIASFQKPMIVSTGMNDLRKISKAVNILEKYSIRYALLHTTNLYPTEPRLVRLGGMQTLMREFPDIPIGLSDHTKNNYSCIAAMTLGAKVVERHFTDDLTRKGPDIICSMDGKQLQDLLQAAQEVPSMLGGQKEEALEEKVTSAFAFASVVTIKPIKKGEAFTKDNLWVKRPGNGELLAEEYESILGKIAKYDLDQNIQLKRNMVE